MLTVNDQLTVLHDILTEQSEEHCAEIAEYKQIKRIIQTLMAKDSISDEQLLSLLPEIYNYGIQGENAQNLEEHVATNKSNIETWTTYINQSNLE
ncbi:YtzH-like family protein [Virgibacillus flavescens]|uniref:YtzH-like family protein n=1 Tax=Virgibacillus flavescens TaxID=1611422 RepID=UPI003D351155